MATHPLIVFDVNETLLDLRVMEPVFERIFGDKSVMRLWFADLIMYSAVLTLAKCYVPFTDIGSAVMKMLADTHGIRISEADKGQLIERFSTMPGFSQAGAPETECKKARRNGPFLYHRKPSRPGAAPTSFRSPTRDPSSSRRCWARGRASRRTSSRGL